jgi:hypothetical protein
MKKGLPHRGAADDPAGFARAFVRGRLGGFQKDIQICLTGIPSSVRPGLTHAYFPALTSCCATLEYLAGLYLGEAGHRALGHQDVAKYATRFLRQDIYDPEAIRVLFDAFRHAVAHRGIASGVWTDEHEHPDKRGRRFTWKVYALDDGAALQVLPDTGELKNDPPWRCRYTHRVHIRLQRLARDICDSSERYIDALVADRELQANFMRCMKALYPK